jgi:ParB family transcriptional regulator, chromosome partitioning protein
MSPRKSTKTFGGKITTPQPSWLSETESSMESADSGLVKLSDIHRPKEQPRRYFDESAEHQLVASIKLHGILQPLLVRPLPSGGYELVAGERRYRAASIAQLSEVPVVVKELSDESAWVISLMENLQREDLNPLEETEGILQLLAIKLKSEVEEIPRILYRLQKALKHSTNDLSDEPTRESLQVAQSEEIDSEEGEISEENDSSHNVMGNSELEQSNINNHEDTQSEETPFRLRQFSDQKTIVEEIATVEEVFKSLGLMHWSSFVKNRLPILNLPEDIKLALRSGKIAYTKAIAISSLKDAELRAILLSEAIEKQLSLSQIKERIKELQPANKTQSQEIPDRLKVAYQQVKKNRLWEDRKKRRQLETLLNKLEALIGQTNQ